MSDEHGPLQTLAWKLCSIRPPSLAILFGRFESHEEYKDFVALVREFLPERELEILRQPSRAEQVHEFCTHFSDRYFPLADAAWEMVEEDEGYYILLNRIPLILNGIGCDDYHEIPESYRDGLQLMTYLLADPWGEGGARVPLAEACRKFVPVELLQRVPEDGLSLEDARELLYGTQYEAVARWGEQLYMDTGNFFLDTDEEMFWHGSGPDWEREEVEALIHHWQLAELQWALVTKFAEWLEEDTPARFRELLDFIEGKHVDEPDPRQGTLALVFANEP